MAQSSEKNPSTTGPSKPPPSRWAALGLLCAAMFMVALDGQIVILAMPSIQADLGFSVSSLQWVLSGYLLSFGGLLLLAGRAADLLGHRRLFVIGVVLFLASSVLCGAAWSQETLIIARLVQGASAAIMSPTALALLMTTFDEGPDRNRALAIWTGTGAFGATAALLIGGVVTDLLGWEWIFYLNIPVAAVMLALVPVLLRESHTPATERSFDLGGAITSTGAAVVLIYAVVEAPNIGWGHSRTIGLLAAAAVLVALFVVIEKKSVAPLVPFRIFKSSSLVSGNLMMIVVGMLLLGFNVLVSLYAQQVLLFTPVIFGLGTLAYALMDILSANVAGVIVGKIGYRVVALAGMVLFGIGSLLMTAISADGSYFSDLFVGLLVFGSAVGTCFVAVSIAALTGVPDEDAGLASGINNAAFWIGGALGSAVVSTVAVIYTKGTGPAALTEGFQAGFWTCVALAAVGAVIALILLLLPQPAEEEALPAAH
ncbi:MFS transporter [Herbidospora mongoliensis]|uniref:MFS transporter n=1 Tax=Herbidospora mongoliensis TaxID=688067 RepID=UPI000831D2F8|nr:MFS transporter [Herbidospora mongoliensis]